MSSYHFLPHDYYLRLSYSSQADGSSFLQMGASLEQQILCMFKVQKCVKCTEIMLNYLKLYL